VHHTRFPAPDTCEMTPKAKAFRAFRAAERLARYLDRTQSTHMHSNRLEEMDWRENYWDDSCTSELGVYAGNWNTLDAYERTQVRVDVPGGEWPKVLAERLERLGAAVVWCDQHSTCDDCGRLIRTDADHMGWRPDFYVGGGEITCIGCLQDQLLRPEDVREGCATILWASAWADFREEIGESVQGEITEQMPALPEAAYTLADQAIADFLTKNRTTRYVETTLEALLVRALRADIEDPRMPEGIPHADDYCTRFGECLAHSAMGAGVSWGDDHAEPRGMEWPSCFVTGVPDLEALAAEAEGREWCDVAERWVRVDGADD
jgi:hypothetical protein